MAINWFPFVGCLSIAFGPSVTLFLVTAASEAQAVILLIASAFFWLLSLLLSSLVWLAAVPLRKHLAFTLFFSVIFQEALRVLFVLLVKKTNTALSRISRETTDLFHGPRYSIIAGLGYGVMSAMFMYVNVLSEASGPGTYYTPGSPSMPIFVSGALQGSVMTFLHVCWGLLCSEAVEKRDWKLLLGVTLSHMFVSAMTLLNEAGFSPLYSLLVSYLTLAVVGTFTFRKFRGQVKPFFKVL